MAVSLSDDTGTDTGPQPAPRLQTTVSGTKIIAPVLS